MVRQPSWAVSWGSVGAELPLGSQACEAVVLGPRACLVANGGVALLGNCPCAICLLSPQWWCVSPARQPFWGSVGALLP